MTSQSRRRNGRNTRVSGSLTQSPWKSLRYHNPPFALLGEDAIESIHRAALSILQETGMVILAVLAFNFVGEGLRDAADPYAT